MQPLLRIHYSIAALPLRTAIEGMKYPLPRTITPLDFIWSLALPLPPSFPVAESEGDCEREDYAAAIAAVVAEAGTLNTS